MSRPEDTLRDLGALVRSNEAFARELEALAARAASSRASVEGSAKSLPSELLQGPSEALIQRITSAAHASVEKPPVRLDQSIRARSKALAAAVIVPLALAAAWLMWLQASPPPDVIAVYSARIEGAAARVRTVATDSGPLRLRPNQELELWLTPAHDVAGELTAKVYLVNNKQVELHTTIELATTGSLHLVVQIPAELPRTGELVVLVGRPALLQPQLLGTGETSGPGWQRLTRPFEQLEH